MASASPALRWDPGCFQVDRVSFRFVKLIDSAFEPTVDTHKYHTSSAKLSLSLFISPLLEENHVNYLSPRVFALRWLASAELKRWDSIPLN